MSRRGSAALFLSIAIAIVIPTIALAAVNTTGDAQVYNGIGLVPCGVSSDPNVATECEACNVVQLIQGIITFLIGIAVPIAMAMFAYAGFLYFSSGIGGSENISKAKKIFSSSAFGFALALGSWLIVNTILYTVLDKTQYPNSSWFHIDCSSYRPRANNIGTIIAQHLGLAPAVTQQAPSTPVYSCGTGLALSTIGGTQYCVSEDGKTKTSPTIKQTFGSGSGVLCSPGNLACSTQSLMNAGISQARANALSCIAITESSGNPNAQSNSSTACGTFQILKSNWNDPTLHSGNCSSSVSCNNAECNMQAAIALGNVRKTSGQSYYSDWTCPGCNNKAAACVAQYDPGH